MLSHEEATENDLQALKFQPYIQRPHELETTRPINEPLVDLPVTEGLFQDVPVLSSSLAELYLFDTDTDVFVIQEKTAQVEIALNSEFDSTSRSPDLQTNVSLDHRSPGLGTFYVDPNRRRNEPSLRHGELALQYQADDSLIKPSCLPSVRVTGSLL